jgi:hypothetical protein
MEQWVNGQYNKTYRVTVANNGCSASAQVDVPKNPEGFIWIFPAGCIDKCRVNTPESGSIIGPREVFASWEWQVNTNAIVSGVNTMVEPLLVDQSGTFNLEINNGTCEVVSNPLSLTVNPCMDCPIQNAYLKEVTSVPGRFCSFTVSLDIISNANNYVATISAPNDDLIIIPQQFNLQPGANNPIFTMIPTGTFTGSVYNLQINGMVNGQPCVYSFTITLPPCGGTNSREENEAIVKNSSSLQLVPNPATSEVNIAYTSLPSNATIELVDLTGRLLTSHLVNDTTGSWTIPTTSYPAGIYIVVVRGETGLLHQEKLIIK